MVDEIELISLGKRFNNRWLFRNVNQHWKRGDRVAIIGANGSGKSSLTAVIAGYLSSTEGKVVLKSNNLVIDEADVWKNISWTSPSLQLPEQLTYIELFEQIIQIRGLHQSWSMSRVESILSLQKYRNQPLKSFSSGMRQRVKLVLAFSINADILILDEPTAHLDSQGVDWYKSLFNQAHQPIVFVATNSDANELSGCNKSLDISTCVPT